ncbi:MAG: hypothetical protein GX265_02190 [Mollicutes bacterium]|nr:hypothetical protein [Mollicutes bacterium]
MRKRIYIIFGSFLMLLFTSGITYSVFTSNALLVSPDQSIAEFIFNFERVSDIDVPLTEMKPGDEKNILFAVSNSNEETYSKVDIEYQITLTTYHFIPLVIELYQVDDEETLIGTCDESKSRNELNELVCNMPKTLYEYDEEDLHNYRLHLVFPPEYNDESYVDLVDFINLKIKSEQKI